MKAYLFYINKKEIPKQVMYSLYLSVKTEVDGECYVLYAFTFDKKMRDEFICTRVDKFILKTIDVDLDQYTKEKSYYKTCQLKYIEYHNFGYSVKILSNENEYHVCKYDWIDLFRDEPEKCFSYITTNTINMLKTKYQDALRCLGLNVLIHCMDEQEYSELESGLIMEDTDLIKIESQNIWDETLGKYVDTSLEIKSKEFNMFVHCFGDLMKKDL